MSIDKLFPVLSAFHPLSDDFKKSLEREIVVLTFPKNYMLLEAPRIAGHAYFLSKGFAMCYTFNEGRKQVEGFWKAGQIILSAKSFFDQVPTQEFIELMTPSEVLCISFEAVMRMFDQFKEANFIYRSLMNEYYEQSRQGVRDLQKLKADERHEKLLVHYPGIEQIIPQEQIASYLGITPQSLSRIKRNKWM